ncbi:MAG: hypothetical protein E6J91_21040 [Deltaproteobacteria bacterium]|nr:MAG: hypothetical protein E6J91_21040 [Deltaproteobacteria bacterium]
MMKMKRLDMLSSERHSLCMMANNHTLFSSLYENPLAAGAIAADLPVETACHDRLVGYLLRERLNSGSAVELATVASLPHVPPRACVEFSSVVSIPVMACVELAAVASLPHVPPRACVELAAVASLPHVPPRACVEFSSVVSIPVIPPRA